MSDAQASPSVLRLNHAEANRLAWAFAISLAVHLFLGGAWYSGQKLGVWERLEKSPVIQAAKILPGFIKKAEAQQPKPQAEPPLIFVNVTQAQQTEKAPDNAKYYSDKNSQAANPTADKETDTPKITGTQDQVAKTIDVPKKEFVPLQPSTPPKAVQAPQPQEEEKARPAQRPGDLAFAKPEQPRPDTGTKSRPRPRTLKEAMAQKADSQIPGEKMRQEGGVGRRLELASLDAKATPFGAYDAAMIEAISQRWYSLLNERSYASDSRGKVVLQFILHQDGRISEMNVAENSAGEVLSLLCQKAVLDPAPFSPWPTEMRRILGEKRNIQFTFYYN
jgi:outer membrane biosynthesis protein TonB